jgi:AcrR family transcriptional regulator
VILQGAATAFATKGFASTAMEEVAAVCGITKEIIYRHFASQPDALRLLLVHAAREPEFADYARDVRSRWINWVLQHRRHDDPVLHRWAAQVAVSHIWNAVLTWLEDGEPARDEEFAQRCLAGVNALWEAWNAPLQGGIGHEGSRRA